GGEFVRVLARTVDETRLTAAQERRADQIHTGRLDHAAVVADQAFAVEDRDLQPGGGGPEARRPDDRPDLAAGQIQTQRGRLRNRSRFEAVRRRRAVVQTVGARPLVDRVEQPTELEIGQLALVPQRSRELRVAVTNPGE